jgi:cytosine/adenosine deaminase-related metal-dependent hydrolase
MAHAIYLSDDEIRLFKQCDGISFFSRQYDDAPDIVLSWCHCPLSNFTLGSGFFPARKVLKTGIKVGYTLRPSV